jgi:predicted DNA binding CopG/RHH family protein
MTRDRRDALLDQDWAAVWEALPEAPPLVPRSKTAQITLRLPSLLLARIKRAAAARSLPYHALARSWILDGLRSAEPLEAGAAGDEPQADQLNVKLAQDVLDELKARADRLRRPYHRLAREWIEVALCQEEERLGLDPTPSAQPAIKDLMVLLLHATDKRGHDAIRGATRLQKLLFVIEQRLAQGGGFYAYNFGPFDPAIKDATEALRLAGFLRGSEPVKSSLPSFAEMMASASELAGPRTEPGEVEEFALNDEGHAAAEQLRQSNRAYQQLFAYVQALRAEWDTSDLIERVYQGWPKYAERSLIRDQVAARASRRRSAP